MDSSDGPEQDRMRWPKASLTVRLGCQLPRRVNTLVGEGYNGARAGVTHRAGCVLSAVT